MFSNYLIQVCFSFPEISQAAKAENGRILKITINRLSSCGGSRQINDTAHSFPYLAFIKSSANWFCMQFEHGLFLWHQKH